MGEVEKLEQALTRAFDMDALDARATAETVTSVFQGEDEVNDEDLDKEIRSLFYSLEKEKLLNVRRTEYKFEGQTRRAYFWRFNDLEQWPFTGERQKALQEELEATQVYRALPPNLWTRHST